MFHQKAVDSDFDNFLIILCQSVNLWFNLSFRVELFRASGMGIQPLFTVRNIHTRHVPPAHIEGSGIDAAEFRRHLYFNGMPSNECEQAQSNLEVDLLAGIS